MNKFIKSTLLGLFLLLLPNIVFAHTVRLYDGEVLLDTQEIEDHGRIEWKNYNHNDLYSSWDLYTDPEFNNYFYSDTEITQDIDLYVNFKANFWVRIVDEEGQIHDEYGKIKANNVEYQTTAGVKPQNAELTLTALPNNGFDFVEWRVGTDLECVPFDDLDPISTNTEYGITIHGNTTVWAVFRLDESVKFSLTLDPNNETSESTVYSNLDYGETFQLHLPTDYDFTLPANKIFVDWYDGENHYEAGDTYTVTDDATLVAQWRDVDTPVYNVTFESNGGSSVATAQVYENDKLTKPANPTLDGYSFDGWYTDVALTQKYDFDSPVTGNFTLYASYFANLWYGTYNTTTHNSGEKIGIITHNDYVLNDGWTATSAKRGTQVTLVAEPKEGYFFVGWRVGHAYNNTDIVNGVAPYESLEVTTTDPTVTFTVNGHITAYAVFESATILEANAWISYPTIGEAPSVELESDNPTQYHVEFVSWCILGEECDPENPILYFVKNLTYELRVRFVAEDGYQFAHDAYFTLNGMETSKYGSNLERQIYWKATKYGEPTYVIEYNYNGGSKNGKATETSEEVSHGISLSQRYMLDGVTIPEGKALDYFLVNSEEYNIDDELMINKDIRIKYMWKDAPVEPLTVTFMVDGEVYDTVEVQYGDTIEPPETPLKVDFFFSAWEYYTEDEDLYSEEFDFNTPIYEDLVLKATWYEEDQKVTVDFAQGFTPYIESFEVTAGTAATAPEVPEDPNWRFDGFYSDRYYQHEFDWTQPITHNTTVYVKWTGLIHAANAMLLPPCDLYTPTDLGEAEAEDDEKYNVHLVYWYEEDPNVPIADDDDFDSGFTYHAVVEFTANEGYEFANDAHYTIDNVETVEGTAANTRVAEFIADGEESFRVNYDLNGGTSERTRVKFHENHITLDKETAMAYVTAPAGKELDYLELNGQRISFDQEVVLERRNTLKYYWKDIKPKYNIVYDYNGGKRNGKTTETIITEDVDLPLDKANFTSGLVAPAGKELDYITINGVKQNFGTWYVLKANNVIKYIWKDIKPHLNNFRISTGSTNNIVLSWNKANTATSYIIYQSTNNKKWTKIATINNANTLSYNKTKLTANKKYYYKMEAYKGTTKLVTSKVLTTKTAPKKTKLVYKKATFNSVTVKVNKVTGAKKYIIEQSTDNKNFKAVRTLTKAGNATLGALNTGTKYYFRVRACNEYNICSAYSKVINRTPELKKPTIKVSSPAKTQMRVKVPKVDGATGYVIERSLAKSKDYVVIVDTPTATSYIDKNLVSKKRYYYRVRAYRIVNGKKVFSAYSKVAYAKVK